MPESKLNDKKRKLNFFSHISFQKCLQKLCFMYIYIPHHTFMLFIQSTGKNKGKKEA
jgi:hypothetical protein